MGNYVVKQINDLSKVDLSLLIKESKEDGFRFVERLVNDYHDGTNTFSQHGEALFGVFNEHGEIVVIGGVNIDPFSDRPNTGRLRRFYVSREYRRNGLGSLLLKSIIDEASKHFSILVLHTDTIDADRFYTSYGFTKGDAYPNSTHYMELH
ncbi:GNAT family N-acetyltransferase [Falsibacillus pallidus]|uniref:Acetyltransferase (GNAT) family protein n=1 Tax=Falsibacillus pallidus TaxID=493781 RepID=A0A370GG22_9BACI|nr:GNAT family N-acetyltransferase [Falsibacillus pallidus]RDI42166.1 acetyltransferase (GNAT) family protein [Falsibacillus pallidus]